MTRHFVLVFLFILFLNPDSSFASTSKTSRDFTVNCGEYDDLAYRYPFAHRLSLKDNVARFWLFERELDSSEFIYNPPKATQIIDYYREVSGRVLRGKGSAPAVVELLNPSDARGMRARYIVFGDTCAKTRTPDSVPFEVNIDQNNNNWYEGTVVDCACRY